MTIVDAGILVDDGLDDRASRSRQWMRLYTISCWLDELLLSHTITCVSMEKLFFTVSNQNNAEFVYAIRGIVIDKCMKKGVRILEYTPIQIKKAITGNGKATKILVQTMIMHRFSLVDLPTYHDAADALGLAYMASKV